jgi:maltose operon protein
MWKIFASLLLLTGALAGCATAPRPYPADLPARLSAYARSGACCDDPSGFTYAQLPEAGSVDLVIGQASPAFEFQSGLSRFAAFRLPASGGPFRVRVKSFFDGPDTPAGSVFYPVLAMMDESFIVTRVSSLENLRLEQSLATPGGASGLAVTAPFDPDVSPERYLVVFTPAVLLGAPPAERREGDVLTYPTLDWLQRRGDALVAASPFGRLSIMVAPIAPPGPG